MRISHGKEQSLLFDLFKAFDQIESIHESDFFSPKRPIFLHACVTCPELPYDISYHDREREKERERGERGPGSRDEYIYSVHSGRNRAIDSC